MKKLNMAVALAGLIMFGLAGTAHATVVITSTLEVVPGVPSDNGGDATEVDYWFFTVNSPGVVTIDTLSWFWDPDGDGISHFMDPSIYLFLDDGILGSGDFIAFDDDSLDTFGDGSTSSFDSFLSLALAAGDYVLAISDFSLSQADAIDGINFGGTGPVFSPDGVLLFWNQDVCVGFDCSFADYQITFTGDVEVTNAVPVPEPSSMLLFGAGLISLVGIGRRSRRKEGLNYS